MRDIANIFHTTIQSADRMPVGGPYLTYIQSRYAMGACSTGWNEATKHVGEGEDGPGGSNHMWKGHKWETIEEVLDI